MKKQIKLVKEIIDDFEKVKSKEFMELFYDFISFFNGYFEKEAIKYIESLSDYSEIQKIELKKELEPEDEEDLINKLSAIFLLWQNEIQEKSIKELESAWIELSLSINNEHWLEYAKKRAWELIVEVDETTQKEVAKIIEYWISKWNNLQTIAKAIDNKFLKYNTYRSSLIAVMEVWNSYEIWVRTQHDEYTDEFWVTWFKSSHTQADSNVRPSHQVNEDAWWIPKNETFPWTDTDHAPHWFNCRCYTDYSIVNPETGEI